MNQALHVLFAAISLIAAGQAILTWSFYNLSDEVERTEDRLVGQVARLREKILGAEQTAAVETALLTGEVRTARSSAALEVRRAQSFAQKHAERLTRKLARAAREQQREAEIELQELHAVSAANHQAIGELKGRVQQARDEVGAARVGVGGTAIELKRVVGDLGVLGGELATNRRELALLRMRGQRTYLEFNLKKSRKPQAIADVALILRRSDPLRHRFTLEVQAVGRKIEKKDRVVNEPIQFYQEQRLYEVVINEVGKDEVRGYLAMPKPLQDGRVVSRAAR